MNSLRGNLTELVNYFFIHKFEQLTVILKERGDVKYLLWGQYRQHDCFTHSSDLSSVEFSEFSVFNEHLHYLPSPVSHIFLLGRTSGTGTLQLLEFFTPEVLRHRHLCDMEYTLDVTTLQWSYW